nr:hypothetical protein [Sphingobium sp. Z007]
MFGIMACHDLAQASGQQVGAGGIMLIEQQPRACACAMDCQQAGAGRGLEQDIVRATACRHGCEPGEAEGRAELLELDLLFRAVGLRWQSALKLPQSLEDVGRCSCQKRALRIGEVQDLRGF